MHYSQLEDQPGESFRRLFLRLPTPNVTEGAAATFDVERFAATLKRSHAEAVTIVASALQSEPCDTPERTAPESPESPGEDFQSHLMAALRGRGLTVETAVSTGQEAGVALDSFPSRPALEAFCYDRLCRGRPLLLEDCLCSTGTFDAEAYRLLGAVFGEIAFKERWYRGAQRKVEIGVVSPEANATASGSGSARIVQAGGQSFDLLEATADFTPYRVVIVPEDVPLDSELKLRLQTYLEQGGKLLASFESGTEAKQSGLDLGEVGSEADSGSGTLRNGNTVLLTQPHFRSYAQSAGARHKRSVLDALKLLLADALLQHDGPGTMEAIVTEQKEQNRWVLHLMHYLRMGIAPDSPVCDDLIPLHEVKISLKTPKPVVRVTLRPQHHDELDFWEHQGRVEFVVPKITGHRMVSIEFAEECAP